MNASFSTLIATASLCIFPALSLAQPIDTYRYPLSEALGLWFSGPDEGSSRAITVDLSSWRVGHLAVEGVGIVTPGEAGDNRVDPFPLYGALVLTMDPPGEEQWTSVGFVSSEGILETAPFRRTDHHEFGLWFLQEGPIEVHLSFHYDYLYPTLDRWYYSFPVLDLLELNLVIVGSVPVETSTWGSVKSLFRLEPE